MLQILACATGPIGCAAASAALTLAAGGTLKQAIIGAALSFAQVGAYNGIHNIIGGLSGFAHGAVKIALHAIVGGAASMAQGGSFETGAFTGAVAAGSSLLMDRSGIDALGQSGDGIAEKVAARTAIAAVAGGTASVLSGGKFANGAITGAFAQLYNAECRGCPRTMVEGGGGSRIGALQGGGGAVGGIGLSALIYGQISGAFDSLLNWTFAPADSSSGMNDELQYVVRGGSCTATAFCAGTGVSMDFDRNLQGISTQSYPGKSVAELAAQIPQKYIGVSTVGAIRAAGGTVVMDGWPGNPYHATIGGLRPDVAESLFTPKIRNPNPRQ